MATGNRASEKSSEKSSRLKNPLNVVVAKVGATRAMVHGDVSVESLKELLMSSLSLLPSSKILNDEWLTKFGASSQSKTELTEREKDGADRASKYIGSSGVIDGEKNINKKTTGINVTDDRRKASSARKLFSARKNFGKTKLKKNIGDRGSRLFRMKFGTKTDLEGINDEEAGEEDNIERSRRSSCLSLLSIEKSPLSNDGHWLQRYFARPLVQGLKDIIIQKPQDPVSYLAFWLREYRSQEETRKRREDFDNELREKRLSALSREMKKEDITENSEAEYYDDEEGGHSADWNFKNYHLVSEGVDIASNIAVQ